ncbi:hypothetical protein MPSEU_000084000 [Mayamaea pseudoterrestris]|nr:hypothetical protein MPSEU_000084000 [Mayamaea pseudoterrestris]
MSKHAASAVEPETSSEELQPPQTPPQHHHGSNGSSTSGNASDAASAANTPSQKIRQRLGAARRRIGAARRRLGPPPRLALENHYRVDYTSTAVPATTPPSRPLRARPIVLPGAPRYEPDWDRDVHDLYNLVVLVPIVVLNVLNWNADKLWKVFQGTGTIRQAWTGDWFEPFLAITFLYFLVDLIWIVRVPTCVKSPLTIVQHHICTLLYLYIPYAVKEYRWCMGACMIVEINTWFLIARRVFNQQGFEPWVIDLSFLSIRIKLISILFYLTWVPIRVGLYPYLLIPFYQLWLEYSLKVHSKFNLVLFCLPLHSAFCLLNLKWTYDLLVSKLRYWRRRGLYSNNQQYNQHVSKGL